MFEIKYEIGLNDEGRPYIELPDDYEQHPEDRFFMIELTRYMLQDLLKRRTPDLDSDTVQQLDESERLLGQLGDEMAKIIYDGMRVAGESAFIYGGKPKIFVNSKDERDALPDKDILYRDMIFDRKEGLHVIVQTPMNAGWHFDEYVLVGGITNEHWIKLL